MFWRNTYFQISVALLVFLIAGWVFPEVSYDSDLLNIVLSIATFTFAIILAFSIARRHSRLSELRGLLRANDASIIEIYTFSKLFGKKISLVTQKLLDDYLMLQLDYTLTDYYHSYPGLMKLKESFLSYNPRTEKQKTIYDHCLYLLEQLTARHKAVEHLVRDRMLFYEWGSLLTLSGIIWFSLLVISDGTPITIILVALLSTSFVLFLSLLQDLDNLSWQEREWIWLPLAELFLAIDLLPYIPQTSIQAGQIAPRHLRHLKRYRLAIYTHQYPNFKGKKIKIIKNK